MYDQADIPYGFCHAVRRHPMAQNAQMTCTAGSQFGGLVNLAVADQWRQTCPGDSTNIDGTAPAFLKALTKEGLQIYHLGLAA